MRLILRTSVAQNKSRPVLPTAALPRARFWGMSSRSSNWSSAEVEGSRDIFNLFISAININSKTIIFQRLKLLLNRSITLLHIWRKKFKLWKIFQLNLLIKQINHGQWRNQASFEVALSRIQGFALRNFWILRNLPNLSNCSDLCRWGPTSFLYLNQRGRLPFHLL